MIDPLLLTEWIKVLLALTFITGALVVTRRDLFSLVSTYAAQSFLLVLAAVFLYLLDGSSVLLYLAALTLISKVILIPYVMRSIQREMRIKRDLEFHYFTPARSLVATIILILLVYTAFSEIIRELALSNLFYLGAVFGVSLTLMGMMVAVSRKKLVTKIIGYLVMENGVLLFSLFLAELPFIVEVLIMIDLFILVLLALILTIGIDSSIEEFHMRLHPFHGWSKEED
ncbi:Uncharacterised protein [uncultured archaeon]|nr:Uncharacterised protein [uncultured archaeon]